MRHHTHTTLALLAAATLTTCSVEQPTTHPDHTPTTTVTDHQDTTDKLTAHRLRAAAAGAALQAQAKAHARAVAAAKARAIRIHRQRQHAIARARARTQHRTTNTADRTTTRPALAVLPLAHYRLTAGYGRCGHLWTHCHTGQDFAAPYGTRVRAILSGTVTAAGWAGAYGLRIKIRHHNGDTTWYGHLSTTTANVGQHVTAGDTIGRVGTTGHTTGPHLHLEVHTPGLTSPLRWLRGLGLDP